MKLIRDKLALTPYPDRTLIVVDVETQKLLIRDKVVEEAHELWNAKSYSKIVEELGDLLDVIHRLKKLYGIEDNVIEESRQIKNEERGGFEQGFTLL